MNNDPADEKLQRLFDGSRADDARRAPAFGEVLTNRRTAPRTAVRWGRVAAAAAAILAVGAAVMLLGRGNWSIPKTHTGQVAVSTLSTTSGPFDSAHGYGPAAELTQWTAVSTWRASTDSLLTDSGLLWGSRITIPTDALINSNSVSGGTGAGSKKGKEAL